MWVGVMIIYNFECYYSLCLSFDAVVIVIVIFMSMLGGVNVATDRGDESTKYASQSSKQRSRTVGSPTSGDQPEPNFRKENYDNVSW